MSEERLVLHTKKSLYEPIEVEVDGQVYQSAKTTNAVIEEVNKLDGEIVKHPTDSKFLYKAVQLLFDIKTEVLDKLDKREVEDIYTFTKKRFAEIEKQRAEIITKSLTKIWEGKVPPKKAREIIPSEKRPGDKR